MIWLLSQTPGCLELAEHVADLLLTDSFGLPAVEAIAQVRRARPEPRRHGLGTLT